MFLRKVKLKNTNEKNHLKAIKRRHCEAKSLLDSHYTRHWPSLLPRINLEIIVLPIKLCKYKKDFSITFFFQFFYSIYFLLFSSNFKFVSMRTLESCFFKVWRQIIMTFNYYLIWTSFAPPLRALLGRWNYSAKNFIKAKHKKAHLVL